MVLKLHVWGPAFTLPSIDPLCLAAVAYVAQTVPRGQWVLVASSDEGLIPANANHARGFAFCSFTSHLHAHAAPLLDLYLYVSSENYTTVTRPAYSQFLSWPAPYTIPPTRRARAKSRTSHLNLSALDLDHIDSDQREREKHASLIPESFRTAAAAAGGQQTVTGLLKRQRTTTARFKLDGLVDSLCDPLARLLGEKRYFLSDQQLSSLDCLALGYLSLALVPDVPQPWLRQRMSDCYPNLCAFVERMRKDVFGGAVPVSAALSPSPRRPNSSGAGRNGGETGLPWQPPAPTTMAAKATTLMNPLMEALPFGPSKIIMSDPASPGKKKKNDNNPAQAPTPSFLLPLAAAAVAAAVVAAASSIYIFDPFSVIGWKKESTEKEKRLEDMGEAGWVLAGLDS
ncbi:MAG: hypothetical protein Q9163_006113 [Psora crenata]